MQHLKIYGSKASLQNLSIILLSSVHAAYTQGQGIGFRQTKLGKYYPLPFSYTTIQVLRISYPTKISKFSEISNEINLLNLSAPA